MKNQEKDRAETVESLARRFCREHWKNEEMEGFAVNLCRKLGRKRSNPLTSGRPEIWASAVIYVLARANFLFDKESELFTQADDIADFFGVVKSSASQKATRIEKELKMTLGDPDYCFPSISRSLTFVKTPEGVVMPQSLYEKMILGMDEEEAPAPSGEAGKRNVPPREVRDEKETAAKKIEKGSGSMNARQTALFAEERQNAGLETKPGATAVIQGPWPGSKGNDGPSLTEKTGRTRAVKRMERRKRERGDLGKAFVLEVELLGGPFDEDFRKGNPRIVRRLEVAGDQTLSLLHFAIHEAFDREEEHLWEFVFDSEKGHGKEIVFHPEEAIFDPFDLDPDMEDSNVRMASQAPLGSLKLKPGDAFEYVFDFGDEWVHSIKVVDVVERESGIVYPRFLEGIGDSPHPYDEWLEDFYGDEEDEDL